MAVSDESLRSKLGETANQAMDGWAVSIWRSDTFAGKAHASPPVRRYDDQRSRPEGRDLESFSRVKTVSKKSMSRKGFINVR